MPFLITGGLFFSLLAGNDITFSNCMAFCLESYDHNYPSYQESIFDTKQHPGSNQLAFDFMYSNASLFPASQAVSALNFPGLWVGDTYVTATAALAAYKQGFVPPHDRAFKQLVEAIAAYEEERLADQRMLDEMALAKKAWEYNRKMAAEQARQRVITDHLKRYGVSYEYLWAKKTGLYRLNDFDQVVHRILAMTDITHAQAYAIIKGYCDKRCFHKDEKRHSKYVINQAFKHRERLKAQQQREAELYKIAAIKRAADEKRRKEWQALQEQQQVLKQQQKVLATYRPVLDFCASHTDTAVSAVGTATYQTQRQQALDKTVADGGKQHVKSYELDACTQGFLLQHEINPNQFQSLSSTIFGHQLFSEFEQLYKKIAKTTFECLLKSELNDDCVGFVQLGFEATQQEQFVLAATLSDFANTWADFTWDIFKDGIDTVCQVIDIVRHSKSLTDGMDKLLAWVGAELVECDQRDIPLSQVEIYYYQQSQTKSPQEFAHMVTLAQEQFYQWWQKDGALDKFQAAARLLGNATCALPLLGKTMGSCGKILTKAHELAKLEKIAAMAQRLGAGFQEAQQVWATTESVLQSVPTTVADVESSLTCLVHSQVNAARNIKNIADCSAQISANISLTENALVQQLIDQNYALAKQCLKFKISSIILHASDKNQEDTSAEKSAANLDDNKKSENNDPGDDPNKDPEDDDDPLPEKDKGRMNHIFLKKEGHMLDTPENRNLLRDLVKDIKNYCGQDTSNRNDWYAKIMEDGKQLWARVRNKKIISGGINNVPREWCPETGLCKSLMPKG